MDNVAQSSPISPSPADTTATDPTPVCAVCGSLCVLAHENTAGNPKPNLYGSAAIVAGRLLCWTCGSAVCHECGTTGADVMRRFFIGYPALCTACCSMRPGREWMRHDEHTDREVQE